MSQNEEDISTCQQVKQYLASLLDDLKELLAAQGGLHEHALLGHVDRHAGDL